MTYFGHYMKEIFYSKNNKVIILPRNNYYKLVKPSQVIVVAHGNVVGAICLSYENFQLYTLITQKYIWELIDEIIMIACTVASPCLSET